MSRNRSWLSVLGAAAVLGLAACSDQATSPIEDGLSLMLNADVARVAADGAGEEVEIMRDPGMGSRFGVGLGFGAPPSTEGCTYGGTYWTCPPVSRGPLTFSRSFGFFNAAGSPMEHYDANLTASVNLKTKVEGEISREHWSGTVESERDMTVSGLQGDEQRRTWNGTGHSETSRSRHTDEGAARTYNMESDVTVEEVVVPHRNNENQEPWPLSGTITRHMQIEVLDGDGNVLHEVERTVVITFNATQFAPATVTGPRGTEEFTIDLAERRPHHRRP
jgi:hypothetical protein